MKSSLALVVLATTTATAGPSVRFGLTGALSDQAAPEQHELGPQLAIGERLGPLLLEADYAYLSFMDGDVGKDGMQRLGVNLRADLVRNINDRCSHRWMACTRGSTIYGEAGVAERYGQWHLDAVARSPANGDRQREFHVGVGLELDNRIAPYRYGWQIGLRLAFAEHDPMQDAVCRGSTCMPAPGQRGADRAVLVEWTFLVGQ
jgi:hypothetical protein